MPTKNGDHFEVTMENIPAFEKEAYAPPEDELKPRVELHYTAGKTDVGSCQSGQLTDGYQHIPSTGTPNARAS